MSLISLSLSALLVTAGATEVEPEVGDVMRLLAADPPIAEVQKAALDHFAVSHMDIASYRAAARLRSLLPQLTGSFTQDDSKTKGAGWDFSKRPIDPANPATLDNTNGTGRAYTASASWTLSGLVFDSNELEAYALVGIQEDVVTEVTRLYYTRQHNILALALEPPKDARTKVALMLRTREIEAMLDAMTGGAWTRLKSPAR